MTSFIYFIHSKSPSRYSLIEVKCRGSEWSVHIPIECQWSSSDTWDIVEMPTASEIETRIPQTIIQAFSDIGLQSRKCPTMKYRICLLHETPEQLTRHNPYQTSTYYTGIPTIGLIEYGTATISLISRLSDFRREEPSNRLVFTSEPPLHRTSITAPGVAGISPFAAKLIVQAALTNTPDIECPVTMEHLASLPQVAVAPCGHLCSVESSQQLKKCPVCREVTAWTIVSR